MTKFDLEMEKVQQRRYEDRICRLNEELALGLKTRTRENTFWELKSALFPVAQVFDCFNEKQPANA